MTQSRGYYGIIISGPPPSSLTDRLVQGRRQRYKWYRKDFSVSTKESKYVWSPVRDNAIGHWERMELMGRAGFPDCICILPGLAKKTCLVELKYLDAWPKRSDTETKLNIKGIQSEFMRVWHSKGGRGFFLVRVGHDLDCEWLLIPGHLGSKTTQEDWKDRAIGLYLGMPDWMDVCRQMENYVG